MRIIIKPVSEIDERCRFISYDSKAMPIMARDPDQLQVVSCGYNLIQLPRLVIIGADLHRSANGQEMIHLTALMPMPGSDHIWIADGHICLNDVILDHIAPILSHDFGEKSTFVSKSLQWFNHNSRQHHDTSYSISFFRI